MSAATDSLWAKAMLISPTVQNLIMGTVATAAAASTLSPHELAASMVEAASLFNQPARDAVFAQMAGLIELAGTAVVGLREPLAVCEELRVGLLRLDAMLEGSAG